MGGFPRNVRNGVSVLFASRGEEEIQVKQCDGRQDGDQCAQNDFLHALPLTCLCR